MTVEGFLYINNEHIQVLIRQDKVLREKFPGRPRRTFPTEKDVAASVSFCSASASGWNKDEDGMCWQQTMLNARNIPSIGFSSMAKYNN
jgi:hypothetical protein